MKNVDVSKLTQAQLNSYFRLSVFNDDALTDFWLSCGAEVTPESLGSAIMNDNKRLGEKIINAGVDVNYTGGDIKEAILFSVLHDVEWVDILAKGNLDVNVENIHGETPLGVAYNDHHEAMVDKLLELGADIDNTSYFGFPVLIDCIMRPDEKWLNKFISAKANVNVQDRNFSTPLIFAVKRNHDAAVYKLLEAGADPNIRDYEGTTALMSVLSCPIAGELIKFGADVNAIDEDGYTPLMRCIRRSTFFDKEKEFEGIITLLLENGANPNCVSCDGTNETALKLAYKSKHKSFVKIIKEYCKK